MRVFLQFKTSSVSNGKDSAYMPLSKVDKYVRYIIEQVLEKNFGSVPSYNLSYYTGDITGLSIIYVHFRAPETNIPYDLPVCVVFTEECPFFNIAMIGIKNVQLHGIISIKNILNLENKILLRSNFTKQIESL